MSSFGKYLERHAEAEARVIDLRGHGPWAHGITIPARRESLDCLRAVAAPAARARTLLVLVVNAAECPEDRRHNAVLMAALEARARPSWRAHRLSLHRLSELDVLLVDRSTPPYNSQPRTRREDNSQPRTRREDNFGPRDGVGLARKIGADLIARLIADGLIASPWIHTTDADAELPAEHFDRLATLPAGAAVAPFIHVDAGDPEVHDATLRYELSLRYYVLGLRRAGSAYAFHTIGSLISVDATRYVQARGFPRRQAGEDFYLLNKLAKLGPVHRLGGEPVRIRSRRSTRAPFGTGPAVEALLAGKPLEVYDPRVFEALGRALALNCDQEPPADLPELADWVQGARMLAERYGAEQLPMRVREHFDGFRTLKLIHALTRRWPKLPWSQALARAQFASLSDALSIAEQRDRLAWLEGSSNPQRRGHEHPEDWR